LPKFDGKQIRLQLPRPHPAQQQVIREAARFNILACGRRWGKSTLAVDRCLQPALKGAPAAWCSPTYKSLADTWREVRTTVERVKRDKSETEKRIELIGGGTIEFWSLDDPNGPLGRKYACLVIDEAALVPDLQTCWEETLRPTLTDLQGTLWALSTPRGIANYFHTLYQRGQHGGRADWRSWRMPSRLNPHIPAAEIELARLDMSELAYQQEFEATFVSWEGQVFRKISDAILTGPPSGKAVAIGVDWARGAGGDYTVFVVISEAAEVLEIDRFRGMEYSLQRARLAALYERHGQPTIIAESNAMGGPVCEQLQRDGLRVRPFVTTSVSKAEGVEALALGFERGRIKIPDDPALIGELQAFEATQLPSGRMQYAAPSGLHDDLVMALMLAYSAVSGVLHMAARGIFQFYEEGAKALAAGKVAPIDRGQPAENPQRLLSKELGHILRRW
jgi:hypothetical protein